jgi:hypothetical protein
MFFCRFPDLWRLDILMLIDIQFGWSPFSSVLEDNLALKIWSSLNNIYADHYVFVA